MLSFKAKLDVTPTATKNQNIFSKKVKSQELAYHMKLTSMTASVKILTTSTLDSSPSIILVSPNGHRTLIGCGEGCQRSFLESSSDRVRSVNQVCLTHIDFSSTGGLPGMILTSADAAQASQDSGSGTLDGSNNKRDEVAGTLKIIGPNGTKDYIHSLRHFMKRDRFPLTVYEGEYEYIAKQGHGIVSRYTKGKKRKHCSDNDDDGADDMGMFSVKTVPMTQRINILSSSSDTNIKEIGVTSFIFKTTPIKGKFQVETAKKIGIPPGPLYSQLKQGQTITFTHPTSGEIIEVTPDEVLEEGNNGVTVILIYCPDDYVFEQIRRSSAFQPFQNASDTSLELVIHYTPKTIFQSAHYQEWINLFSIDVKHMTLHPMNRSMFTGGNESLDGTPFRSAILGAMQRSMIHSKIFPNPLDSVDKEDQMADNEMHIESENCLSIINARSQLEYTIIPIAKKGTVTLSSPALQTQSLIDKTKESGAVDAASDILESICEDDDNVASSQGSFIFTGTGSAIPCKHRNVTGMYLEMSNEKGMLLDCGEGTIGQLIRCWKSERKSDISSRMLNIKAAWISHPHADHHLGLIRLLSERNAIAISDAKSEEVIDPLVLVASNSVFRFLEEYALVDPSISSSYIPVDCIETIPGKKHDAINLLNKYLGLTNLISVPVSHCYQSFGVVLDGTSFGRLVYSGDCRPSDRLVAIGKGADLLVHEATFEDGMEEEAILKKHSTVGEALIVAKRMNAKACILTHFSQRYPRIPPNDSVLPFPVAFAFDYMHVTPANITTAAILTPSLRMLYPEDDNETNDDSTKALEAAKRKLSTPGMFANSALCT
jgi:ribonuclease Z